MPSNKPTRNEELLGQFAKLFVMENLGIDPALWALTSDQAWVSIAARLLRHGWTTRF